MEKWQTGFWDQPNLQPTNLPNTVPMPPVTNALVPSSTTAPRYLSQGAHPKGQAPAANPVMQPQQPAYMPWPYMYPPPYGYPYTMPTHYGYPMPQMQTPMMYAQQPANKPVPLWTSNMQRAKDIALSALGSILLLLPYTLKEKGKIELDLADVTSRLNLETNEIEHCLIFGMPGVDEGVYTYRGNLESCTEVMNLLHSGKFKVGFKRMCPSPVHSDSRTSLERLFAETLLESIPESGILPTDEEMEKERRYLYQRLQELKNISQTKSKIKEEQREIKKKASTPKGLSDIWKVSLESLKKEGKK